MIPVIIILLGLLKPEINKISLQKDSQQQTSTESHFDYRHKQTSKTDDRIDI